MIVISAKLARLEEGVLASRTPDVLELGRLRNDNQCVRAPQRHVFEVLVDGSRRRVGEEIPKVCGEVETSERSRRVWRAARRPRLHGRWWRWRRGRRRRWQWRQREAVTPRPGRARHRDGARFPDTIVPAVTATRPLRVVRDPATGCAASDVCLDAEMLALFEAVDKAEQRNLGTALWVIASTRAVGCTGKAKETRSYHSTNGCQSLVAEF